MDGRKHAVLEIGGKIYNLNLSYNAMCEFTDHVGNPDILETRPLTGYRGLVWAGINACGNKSVTIEEAGDLCEQLISDIGHQPFIKKMIWLLEESGWMRDKSAKNPKAAKKKASQKSSPAMPEPPSMSED